MTRMEVRCCCQPQKLLGWLPVPHPSPCRGMQVTFLVGRGAHYEWRAGEPVFLAAQTVTLPIEQIVMPGDQHLALKSEETPIETLRQIPGFVENVM